MFLTEGAEQTPLRKAAAAFVAATSAVLLHLPLPESLPLHPGVFCLCCQQVCGPSPCMSRPITSISIKTIPRASALWSPTLAMGAEQYPITAIYLHLMAVMDYMSMRQTETARKHLLAAWALAPAGRSH